MDLLREVTEIWGNTTLIESDPGDETVRSAIYVPFRPDLFFDRDPGWGIYHPDGNLVKAAAYYRGPQRHPIGQSERMSQISGDLNYIDEEFVYGGPFLMHYGHFLTASLPRLWHIRSAVGTYRRILCHSHESPEVWFAQEYVRAMLNAIGLATENFVRLESPSILRRLWVPRPAMEEQNFVHRTYGDLGVTIGRAYGVHRQPQDKPPIYLSKTRLKAGITRLNQEHILGSYFAELGFDIVHPQELPFSEQLRLFARARTITGTVGSGLHTSLFLDRPSRIVALAGDNLINSNFVLFDRLKGNDALYLCPDTPWMYRSRESGFDVSWVPEDLAAVAREYAARA